jgi:hypothetical protein
MGRRIDIQADDIRELLGEGRVVRELEVPPAVRAEAFQIACTVDAATPATLAIARNVQWVASCGGDCCVRRTISATRCGGTGALPGGRDLSQSRPATPSCMNRSCQRHTQVLDFGDDCRGAQTAAAQKNNTRPPDVLLRALGIRDDRLQSLTVAT